MNEWLIKWMNDWLMMDDRGLMIDDGWWTKDDWWMIIDDDVWSSSHIMMMMDTLKRHNRYKRPNIHNRHKRHTAVLWTMFVLV